MKELKALIKTHLKINNKNSASLSDDEKIAVSPGSVLLADDLEDVNSYWRLTNATLDGMSVAQCRMALKSHWSEPAEVAGGEDLQGAVTRLLGEGRSVADIAKSLGVDRRRIKRLAVPAR